MATTMRSQVRECTFRRAFSSARSTTTAFVLEASVGSVRLISQTARASERRSTAANPSMFPPQVAGGADLRRWTGHNNGP